MVELVRDSAKTITNFALILFFTALGIVGLLLPILPGFVFLFIAAVLASRHIPALARYLERNPYTAKGLPLGRGFLNLSIWGKVRLGLWGLLKVTVDGVAWTSAFVVRQYRKSRARNI